MAERKFRGQHPGPMWDKFTAMLEQARAEKTRTGKAPIVPRFDVVPMAEHLRKHLSPKALREVSADTAQSMYDFRAEEVIHWISPRPILFLHGADDTVTPTEQSIRLWELAGQPKDLVLITGTDHFPLAGNAKRTKDIVKGWLDKHSRCGSWRHEHVSTHPSRRAAGPCDGSFRPCGRRARRRGAVGPRAGLGQSARRRQPRRAADPTLSGAARQGRDRCAPDDAAAAGSRRDRAARRRSRAGAGRHDPRHGNCGRARARDACRLVRGPQYHPTPARSAIMRCRPPKPAWSGWS
ncbi:MAG: alpha/beta hydrolase [Pseudomonadota bacterium]